MKIGLSIILIIFASIVYATTLEWDHDCEDTTGFKLYRSDKIMNNPVLVKTTQCPETQTVIDGEDGYYIVSAFNDYGESIPSNTLTIAAYYYNSIKYEYDANGRIIYKGEHTVQDALNADMNWVITKYFYINDQLTGIRIRITSWDDRALGW